MSEVYSDLPLPDDARAVIEAPLVPFEELKPSDPVNGLYELDERLVDGGAHKVHQFLKKTGGKLIILTQVETDAGDKLFEVDTPEDKAKDRLIHTFATAPVDKVRTIYSDAA